MAKVKSDNSMHHGKCPTCGRTIDVFLNVRHGLDRVFGYAPKGHKHWTEANQGHITLREELERPDGYTIFRTDIALISLANGKQHTVEPGKDGKPYGSGLPFLTRKQMAWCVEENKKLVEEFKREPVLMAKYLRW